MLISEVLRILDRQEAPQRETVKPPEEPFSALLSSQAVAAEPPGTLVERTEATGMAASFPAKGRAEPFPIERHTYDSFLRALKESTKPRAPHALDLFQ